MKRFTLLLLLACVGCAAKRPQSSSGVALVDVPRACIEGISLTEQTECVGPSEEKLHCEGVQLDIKRGCATVRVAKSQ